MRLLFFSSRCTNDSMKEHDTFPGTSYFVTCKAGCTITDASGELELTCEPGHQQYVNAPSDKLYTSENAVVRKATFNYALAELGLLGGGDTLPAGYIKAEFLESNAASYIDTQVALDANSSVSISHYPSAVTDRGCLFGARADDALNFGHWNPATFSWYNLYNQVHIIATLTPGKQRYLLTIENGVFTNKYGNEMQQNSYESEFFECLTPCYLFTYSKSTGPDERTYLGRIYWFKLSNTQGLQCDFVPAIDAAGSPCMYDKIRRRAFYNLGDGQFIVGMTVDQARNLRKLPDGGGELTISLPSNWQEDASVVDALATAEANEWVLTIQTYEAEAGAVSTFALRRIWVRKRAEQNGSYVAADGSRWQIDWCATMVGGDPQEHGYEPFRSVEAAAAYWELVPYVDPEQEQLLTD